MFHCKCQKCIDCIANETLFFREIEQEHKSEFCSLLFPMQFPKKQIIALEGNPAQNIFLIKGGIFKTYKSLPRGKQQIIRICRQGDFIQLNTLYQQFYTETVETVTDAETCTIIKSDFESFIERTPRAALLLIKTLAKELTASYETVRDLGQKNARERVARFIVSLIDKTENEKKPVVLDLELSRREVANIIGTTQETLIRILNDFKKNNLIEIDSNQILIKDVSRMKTIAR